MITFYLLYPSFISKLQFNAWYNINVKIDSKKIKGVYKWVLFFVFDSPLKNLCSLAAARSV